MHGMYLRDKIYKFFEIAYFKATFKCPECPYISKRKSHLNSHVLTHGTLSEVSTFKCTECPYVTKYKDNLNNHSAIKTFKCLQCLYITKCKSSLNTHVFTYLKL